MTPTIQTDEKKEVMRRHLEKNKDAFRKVLLDLICFCKPRCRLGRNPDYHHITNDDVDQVINDIMNVEHWWFSRETAKLTCDAMFVKQAKIILKREYPSRHTYSI